MRTVEVNSMGDKVVCNDGKLQWEDRDRMGGDHWKDEKWWERWVVTKMFEMMKSFTVKKDEKSPQWWRNCLQWEQMRSHISGDKFVFNEKSPQWWRGTSSHHGAHRSQGSRWRKSIFYKKSHNFSYLYGGHWSALFVKQDFQLVIFVRSQIFSQWIPRERSQK